MVVGAQGPALGLIAAGGAAGTALRMGMAAVLSGRAAVGTFPVATLTVNLIATLLLALLAGRLGRRGHALLATGALGALSTFSTFTVEVVELAVVAPTTALVYLASALAGGVLLARAGLRLAR